ncbi:MAG: hypothetical protein AAGB51_10060 [Planctomycetota bacterium]
MDQREPDMPEPGQSEPYELAPEEAPPPPAPPPSPEPMRPGALCPKCGYDAAGLFPTDVCPECAAPLALAMDPYRLRNAPLPILKKLSRGAARVFWAPLIGIAAAVLGYGMMFMMFLSSAASQTMSMIVGITAAVLLIGGGLVAYVAFYVGWWQLTTPQDGLPKPASRLITRIGVMCLLMPLLGMVGAMVMAVGYGGGGGPGFGFLSMILVTYGLMFIGLGLFFFGSLVYARWLMRRIPAYDIDKYLGLCIWLIPVVYIFGSCIYVGPIAAIVLYAIAIWRVKKAIRDETQSAIRGEFILVTQGDGPGVRPIVVHGVPPPPTSDVGLDHVPAEYRGQDPVPPQRDPAGRPPPPIT